MQYQYSFSKDCWGTKKLYMICKPYALHRVWYTPGSARFIVEFVLLDL